MCASLQDSALEVVLPMATLRNVSDLGIGNYDPTAAPEWPRTWGQLTNLTRLSMDGDRVMVSRDEGRRISFLDFLQGLLSLSVLDLTLDTTFIFALQAEECLLSLTSCLPSLKRLRVFLAFSKGWRDHIPSEAKLRYDKNLERFCDALEYFLGKVPWTCSTMGHAEVTRSTSSHNFRHRQRETAVLTECVVMTLQLVE